MLLALFLEDHVGPDSRLPKVLPEMVCVFQDELQGPIPAEAPYPEVQPVLGGAVQADVGVALDLYSKRGQGCDCGCGNVAAREAAVDHNRSSDLDVGPVGVPATRLLALRSDRACVIIMHCEIKFIFPFRLGHMRPFTPCLLRMPRFI